MNTQHNTPDESSIRLRLSLLSDRMDGSLTEEGRRKVYEAALIVLAERDALRAALRDALPLLVAHYRVSDEGARTILVARAALAKGGAR